MTKEEARREVLAAIRYVAGGLIHPHEAMEKADAYAQAHTDAAMSDTLRLLEAIARRHDGYVQVHNEAWALSVVWRADGTFHYWAKDGEQSRAEAEALLEVHDDA